MCVWTLGTLNAYAPFGSRSQFSFGSISIRWGQSHFDRDLALHDLVFLFPAADAPRCYAAIAAKRPADTLAS